MEILSNDSHLSKTICCLPLLKLVAIVLGSIVLCLSFLNSTNSQNSLKSESVNLLTLSEIRYQNFTDEIMPVYFRSTFDREALEMRIDCKVKNISYSCMSICHFEVYNEGGDRWDCYRRIGVPSSEYGREMCQGRYPGVTEGKERWKCWMANNVDVT